MMAPRHTVALALQHRQRRMPGVLQNVSVAMIVRNEEEMLPGCLSAVERDCEVVIVDTGSTDGTKAIAQAAGAKVSDFTWCDDFAAARNAALKHCTREWVLMLDADERVSAELWKQIGALVKREDAGAATVRMRNVQSHGHVRETRLLRLFRRDELIAYRYPIHEDATASVQAYLSRTGRLLVHLNGTVEHLGYVREYARARGKKDRDKALLEAHLHSEPDNLYTHLKLLELGRFWSDPALTASAAPRAREALERAGAKELREAPWAGELVVLIANALWPEEPGRALGYLESFSPRIHPSAAWQLKRAELLELLGHNDAARAAFAACAALGAQLGDLQLSTVRPRMGLARLAIAEGQLHEALSWAQKALSFAPDDPEAKLACEVLTRQLLP
jgi:hypothetical protein